MAGSPARVVRFRRLRQALAGLLLLTVATLAWVAVEFTRARPDRFAARRATLATAAAGPAVVEEAGFISQAVELRAKDGLRVSLRVLRPAGSSRPLPLVVLLGGHRTGRDAVDLLGAPGRFVVAALDYPYDGPERPRGWRGVLATVPAARRAIEETPAAVLLAIDWLVAQPWADASRLELVGVSLGVPFATVAGALDGRVRRVWLIQGGSSLHEWIGHNLRPRISSPVVRAAAGWLVHGLAHGPSLEAKHWLPRLAPRPVVIIGARDDRRLPPPLVEELHRLAAPPKELIWMEGGHVDRRPESVRHLLDLVRSRLQGK